MDQERRGGGRGGDAGKLTGGGLPALEGTVELAAQLWFLGASFNFDRLIDENDVAYRLLLMGALHRLDQLREEQSRAEHGK